MVKIQHWSALIKYEGDIRPTLKNAYVLTADHLNPKGFQLMNVPLAYEVC